ncbi:MAG: ABC transporter ATP-binding protein [Clostridia bacterium]|nr:ABC transporter ATP-binding protein [Clostridia bacterium]
MLPLDQFSDAALAVLRKQGIKEEDITVALRLDLDSQSNFCEVWLAIDKSAEKLYRINPSADTVETFEFAHVANSYVDNFMTTTRLLAYVYSPEITYPRKYMYENEDDLKKALEEIHDQGETVVVCNCTNACRRKLFAFQNIWERLAEHEEVRDDDPVFEQFNAKCPKCGRVYEDQNRKICKYCTNKAGTFIRLLKYFGKYKMLLAIVITTLILSACISLINPLISGKLMFDQIISVETFRDEANNLYFRQYEDGQYENGNGTVTAYKANDITYTDPETNVMTVYTGDPDALVSSGTGKFHKANNVFLVVGLMLLIAIFSTTIGIIRDRCNARMATRVGSDMRIEVFTAMQRLSMSYYSKNSTGSLINAVNYDTAVIRNFYLGYIPSLFVNILIYIGVLILLFTINWKLTLLVLIPLPFIVLVIRGFMPKLWRAYSKQWRRSSAMSSMLSDSFSGIRVIKAFAKEGEEANSFYKLTDRFYKATLVVNKYIQIIYPVTTIILCIAFQAIWGYGGIEVINQHMTYGELTAYWGYIGLLYGPLEFFNAFINEITNTINSAVRMFETLDTVPEIMNAPDAVVPEQIEGKIEFDHVYFHYVSNRPILKDINFTINPGDHVGLVGHTGSGKSTIANLITRMYDSVSGSIRIDDMDIRQIDIKTLRKNVAIVSQEIYLFYGTILDNIRYAKPDATFDEVVAAAREANAHDFIMNLPEGYETLVGQSQRALSGGEKQRISIARALLLRPRILILDEATAAMDTETERQISSAIDKLIVGRTTLTIAHRLSTLRNCNYIMAIEHGELAEMDTIDNLLAKKGVYYKLYTLQNEQMNKVMQGL